MTMPAGITKRTLTFGAAFGLIDGTDLSMKVTIDPSRSMVWRATGSPAIALQGTFDAATGLQNSMDVPITDQVGWGDGNGNLIDVSGGRQSHLYRVMIQYFRNNRVVLESASKWIAVPLGDGSPIDLDDLVPAGGTGGATIFIPDTWDGRITALESLITTTGSFIGSEISTPGTPAEVAVTAKIQEGVTPKQDKATLKADVGSKIGEAGAARDAVDARLLGLVPLTPPSGFAFRTLPMPNFYRAPNGRYVTDLDIVPLKPAAGVTYFVSKDAVSGGSGTSRSDPTTLPTALAKADMGTIYCINASGAVEEEFFRNSHTLPIIEKNVNIICEPGVVLTAYEKPTLVAWTAETGNIYKATRANTNAVVDKRAAYIDVASGDYSMYEQVANLAAIVKAGQWAIVGSVVYVWALGNANLVTDSSFMRLSLNTGTSVIQARGGITVYLENVKAEGGGTSTSSPITIFSNGGSGTAPKVIMVDCVSKYSPFNGITVTGALWAILIRTRASTSVADCLNYHSGTNGGITYIPDIVEIDCTPTRAGVNTTVETQNCSTSHDGICIIRCGGTYLDAYGPNIAEDGGAKSWNMVGAVGGNRAPTRFWNFAATAAGSIQWIEDAEYVGTAPVELRVDGSSSIFVRRGRRGSMLTAARKDQQGTGTIGVY